MPTSHPAPEASIVCPDIVSPGVATIKAVNPVVPAAWQAIAPEANTGTDSSVTEKSASANRDQSFVEYLLTEFLKMKSQEASQEMNKFMPSEVEIQQSEFEIHVAV